MSEDGKVHEYLERGNALFSAKLASHIEWVKHIHNLQISVAEISNDVQNMKSRVLALEEQNDRAERVIRQEMIDFKAEHGIRLVKIQEALTTSNREFTELAEELDRMKMEAKKNEKEIASEREKIIDLAQFELAANDYDEMLADKNQQEKRLLVVQNSNMEMMMKAVWFQNEIDKAGNQIEAKIEKMPEYEKDLSSILNELRINEERVSVLRAQVDIARKEKAPEIRKRRKLMKRIEALRDEEGLVMNKVELLRKEQIDIISRMTSHSNAVLKMKIQRNKVIQNIGALPGGGTEMGLEWRLLRDDNVRYGNLRKLCGEIVSEKNAEVGKDVYELQRRVERTQKAIEKTKGMTAATKEDVEKYNREEQDLLYVIDCLEKKNEKLEKEWRRMNRKMEIRKHPIFATDIVFSEANLDDQAQEPARILALEQVKREHIMESRLEKTKQQVQDLCNEIDRCEKKNAGYRENVKRSQERLADIRRKQQNLGFFVEKRNPMGQIDTRFDQLVTLVDDMDREVAKKQGELVRQRERVQRKRALCRAVVDGGASPPAHDTKDNKAIFEMERAKLKKLKKLLGTEILRWKGVESNYSKGRCLRQWNDILDTIN